MKKILLFTMMAVALILFTNKANAQLPNGSYGENFTMQDYLGTTYSLYTYTDAGKPVIMDVSAVWCSPCWSYHTSGALETYYNTYGPPGNNTSMVLWIEGDQNPVACLQGTGCGTQGNWTTGTTFPMILTVAPNNNQVCTDYQIGYFPTIYLICPDRKVTEPGQLTAAQLHTAALGCPALSTTNIDASVFNAPTPFGVCGSFTPSLTIQNYGNTTLTSCTVTAKIDGNLQGTVNWTGSLGKYEIDDVVFSAVSGVSGGAHTLTYEITNPNGTTDENTANNTLDIPISGAMPLGVMPLAEGFQSTFPPTNWIIDNPNNDYTWVKSTAAGGFGTTTSSASIDFYNISPGNIDDMYMLPVDMSSSSVASLTFNVAYARYDATYYDKLEVQVSTNCGSTWTTVYTKSGTTLATAADHTSVFIPTATEWRAETVNLNSYAGQSKVFVRFRGTSGYGNDLYVDDINLTSTVSIEEQANPVSYVTVYPNPTAGNTAIEFVLSKAENVSISVINLLGQDVISYDEKTYSAGSHTEYFTTDNMSQGVYYLNMVAGGQKNIQKIVVVK